MPWMGVAVEHQHFFEPDGGCGPSLEDNIDPDVTARNECRRYDAVIDRDGRHLVLRVWGWEIVSEHETFAEACRHAQYLATW